MRTKTSAGNDCPFVKSCLVAAAVLAVGCASDLPRQLQESARKGDVERIQTLLKEGADKDAPDTLGRTPLMLAVSSGNVAAAAALLAAGANASLRSHDGTTAQAVAFQEGYLAVVEALNRDQAAHDYKTASPVFEARNFPTGELRYRGKEVGEVLRSHQAMWALLTPVLPDIRAVQPSPGGVRSGGQIAFDARNRGELELGVFDGSRHEYDQNGGEPPNSQRALYFPGILHKFQGRCLFPVDPSDVAELRVQSFGFNFGISAVEYHRTEKGWLVKGGSVSNAGRGRMKVKKNARVLEIEPAEGQALVFLLTKEGYVYQSGVGGVRTPDGTSHPFPYEGFAEWLKTAPKLPEPPVGPGAPPAVK